MSRSKDNGKRLFCGVDETRPVSSQKAKQPETNIGRRGRLVVAFDRSIKKTAARLGLLASIIACGAKLRKLALSNGGEKELQKHAERYYVESTHSNGWHTYTVHNR